MSTKKQNLLGEGDKQHKKYNSGMGNGWTGARLSSPNRAPSVAELAAFGIPHQAETYGFSSCVHIITHGQNQAGR